MVTLNLVERSRKKTATLIRASAHARETGKAVPGPVGRIPVVIKTLLDALGDEDLAEVVRVYREAMNATRRYWIDEGKDDDGRIKGHWEIEADHRIRILAANMVAAYMEGLPVQRQIRMQGDFVELGELLRDANRSGEGRRLLSFHSLPSGTDRSD